MKAVEGSCQVPVAAYAVHEGGEIWLRAMLAESDGSNVRFRDVRAVWPTTDAAAFAHRGSARARTADPVIRAVLVGVGRSSFSKRGASALAGVPRARVSVGSLGARRTARPACRVARRRARHRRRRSDPRRLVQDAAGHSRSRRLAARGAARRRRRARLPAAWFDARAVELRDDVARRRGRRGVARSRELRRTTASRCSSVRVARSPSRSPRGIRAIVLVDGLLQARARTTRAVDPRGGRTSRRGAPARARPRVICAPRARRRCFARPT